MATRAQARHQSVRRRQKVKPEEPANHARKQKQKEELQAVFSAPVRDADWVKIPFTDALPAEAKLEHAQALAIDAMAEWGVLVEASRASGIGRDMLYRMMKADELFKKRMMHAKRNCMERIEREMIRRGQLKGGDLAGIYVTKNNLPRYREIQRVELTGKGGGPVGYVDVKAELLKKLESIALKSRQGEAVAVGERPKLLKGGSDAEVGKVRKVEASGFEAKSRK